MIKTVGEHYQFRPEDVLGRGGMGTVYLGTDLRTGQRVAIKQLSTELSIGEQGFLERFTREAEALRLVNHPNIVTVFETCDDGDNHYLIMEYVAGGSLEDLLDEHTVLPIERVLEIALDVADALTRAHRLGIVHRDIKPANILLADDGTPRLTDFGVAQLSDKTRVTQTGAVVGTLHYLSPEALNGAPTDQRADIWAFGVVLYEMLAGQRPFEEESTAGLITAILTQPMPDLSLLRSDAPETLVTLIRRMLEKDPEQRIDSVRKVGAEVENIIRGADSSEIPLNTTLMESVRHEEKSRFETTSDPLLLPNHLGVKTLKTETGDEYVLVPRRVAMKTRWIVTGIILAAIVVIFFLAGNIRRDNRADAQATETAGAAAPFNDGRDGRPEGALDDVPALPDDTYLIAVAQVNVPDDGSRENPYMRAVLDQLQRTFESEIPFSNLRVQPVIMAMDGPENMRGAESGAAVVVIGTDNGDSYDVSIQVGDISLFPYLNFAPDVIQRTANVRLTFTDPSEVMVAPHVLSAMAVLFSADGDIFEMMRMITMLAETGTPFGTVESSGISTHLNDFFANYLDNTDAALEAISAAIELDSGNPLLYTYRALASIRTLDLTRADRDATTAQRIGPDDWALPHFLLTNTFHNNIYSTTDITEAIALRPDDWFLYALRAESQYAMGDLEAAQADVDMAMSLSPQANFAHIIGYLIALREGRLTDAGRLMDEMVHKFPDPNFGNRIFDATFGEFGQIAGLLYSSMANLVIGQYERVIEDTDALLEMLQNIITDMVATMPENMTNNDQELLQGAFSTFGTDIFVSRGIAFCNLTDYETALNAYNNGLEMNPDYHMLHLLRSEAHWHLGDESSAEADTRAAVGLSEELDLIIQQIADISAGEVEPIEALRCDNFFDYFINLAEEAESN